MFPRVNWEDGEVCIEIMGGEEELALGYLHG